MKKFLLIAFLGAALAGGCQEFSQAAKTRLEETSMSRPRFLYKVLSTDDWSKSQESVHLSSQDAAFIHLATEEQLDRIIEKFWAGSPAFIVLKVETDKLQGRLVFEANPGGANKYYHLYEGAIPVDAIVEWKVQKSS